MYNIDQLIKIPTEHPHVITKVNKLILHSKINKGSNDKKEIYSLIESIQSLIPQKVNTKVTIHTKEISSYLTIRRLQYIQNLIFLMKFVRSNTKDNEVFRFPNVKFQQGTISWGVKVIDQEKQHKINIIIVGRTNQDKISKFRVSYYYSYLLLPVVYNSQQSIVEITCGKLPGSCPVF